MADQYEPVEVKVVLWIDKVAWRNEYGLPASEDEPMPEMETGADTDDAIQDWFREEVQEYGVNGGNWSAVREVTE